MTAATFKRSIRDLQVWCSSCMVALSGSDPIGVLIGAKRPSGTLVHKIAVHPDHRRQGHGRHLLASLGAKVDRVIINDLKSETYFARLIISAENELHARKIIELDGRPSDCIALAVQQGAPIYVAGEVWDEVEDRSEILKKMEEQGEG